MKKLISLLMTLAMLTGTCVAFAEAESVDHQAALEALLEDAGVELQPGDLSRPFEKALGNTVMQLVLTHTMLTEEQMTEWEAAGAAAHKALEELVTKDAKQSTTILNDAIDGIESISPFVKSMLKRVVFNGLYLRSEVTETERQVIRAIYNALEAELHGADEARTGEILAGVKEAMEGLVGLHNV
ncbi:MAG: hypothetical protein U0L09_06895, partial [Christensenellales bacterium]|nr:hypothetical protein [Christensenellales bacterium]